MEVRQIVKGFSEAVVADKIVHHIYQFRNRFAASMEIESDVK
jgi:hypothetical protein